jgi:hypothetical protein
LQWNVQTKTVDEGAKIPGDEQQLTLFFILDARKGDRGFADKNFSGLKP